MKNSEALARKWAQFVASRPEFPAGDRFAAAFRAGRITRLCECGCNSFDIKVPENSSVQPLTQPIGAGAVFEMEFRTVEEGRTLAFTVFVADNGHLAGLDVDYCTNSFPVPTEPVLLEPPFHVRVSEALTAPSGDA